MTEKVLIAQWNQTLLEQILAVILVRKRTFLGRLEQGCALFLSASKPRRLGIVCWQMHHATQALETLRWSLRLGEAEHGHASWSPHLFFFQLCFQEVGCYHALTTMFFSLFSQDRLPAEWVPTPWRRRPRLRLSSPPWSRPPSSCPRPSAGINWNSAGEEKGGQKSLEQSKEEREKDVSLLIQRFYALIKEGIDNLLCPRLGPSRSSTARRWEEATQMVAVKSYCKLLL